MPRNFPIDLPQYARLRTLLDSLVVGCLRSYLNVDGWEHQQENYAYMEKELTKLIERIWPEVPVTDDLCPDGYFNCGGCCVPYKCID